jgi:hypothetical protein
VAANPCGCCCPLQPLSLPLQKEGDTLRDAYIKERADLDAKWEAKFGEAAAAGAASSSSSKQICRGVALAQQLPIWRPGLRAGSSRGSKQLGGGC